MQYVQVGVVESHEMQIKSCLPEASDNEGARSIPTTLAVTDCAAIYDSKLQ